MAEPQQLPDQQFASDALHSGDGDTSEQEAHYAASEQRREERYQQMRAERLAEKKEHIEKKRQVRSLAEMVESKLLKDLSSCITAESVRATFACGGTLDCSSELESRATVYPGTLPATHTKLRQALPPVDIRFGASGEGVTLRFPHHAADSAEFQRLLAACQPASFGRGTQEVLDENYRKAGKLDRTSFATTFCPYEAGIVDVVGQLLLPQATQDENSRSIRAELYKLNVYSAPSGKFKAHVDTPRSETQVGSLVVCLPLSHEGGQLVVRHAGNEIEFDWSDSGNEKKPSRISWAAFYSDCEHEVLEVTSGHRLTLTYNLYSIRGLGHLAGETAVLDASSLPLYQPLRQALESPGFLRQGRILAIWLTHSYPHTSTMVDLLPSALKGADMALYEAFRALNLWCKVVPVMESSYSRFYDDDRNVYLAGSKFMPFNKCKNRSGNLDPEEGTGFGSEIPSRKTTWLNSQAQGGDEQAQMAYMTYGNEPGIAIHYSRAAMLVRIPPYLERPEAERPKKFYEGIDGYDSDYEYDSYHEYDSYYETNSDLNEEEEMEIADEVELSDTDFGDVKEGDTKSGAKDGDTKGVRAAEDQAKDGLEKKMLEGDGAPALSDAMEGVESDQVIFEEKR